jgi:hypothetical protein
MPSLILNDDMEVWRLTAQIDDAFQSRLYFRDCALGKGAWSARSCDAQPAAADMITASKQVVVNEEPSSYSTSPKSAGDHPTTPSWSNR